MWVSQKGHIQKLYYITILKSCDVIPYWQLGAIASAGHINNNNNVYGRQVDSLVPRLLPANYAGRRKESSTKSGSKSPYPLTAAPAGLHYRLHFRSAQAQWESSGRPSAWVPGGSILAIATGVQILPGGSIFTHIHLTVYTCTGVSPLAINFAFTIQSSNAL